MRPVRQSTRTGGKLGLAALVKPLAGGRRDRAPIIERIGPQGLRSGPVGRKALRNERADVARRWRDGRGLRGLGWAAIGLLFAATALYGGILGGHAERWRAAPIEALTHITRALGFGLTDVRVTGADKMAPREVVERMGLGPGTSLLTLNVEAARRRLLDVPWIRSASVRVYFPSTVEVAIVEREPFALWQRGGQVSLVDRDGRVVGPYDDARFSHLPLVVGEGAERRVNEFAGLLEPHPAIRSRVRAGVLVAERRWTLKLGDGVDVMLPEQDPAGAVALLERLDRDSGLLNRDIAAVDLRLADRVVVRLTDRAAAARADMLRARARSGRPA